MTANKNSRALASLSLVAALGFNAAGYAFNWWDALWWFDDAIHAYTSLAGTLVLGLAAYGSVLTGAHR